MRYYVSNKDLYKNKDNKPYIDFQVLVSLENEKSILIRAISLYISGGISFKKYYDFSYSFFINNEDEFNLNFKEGENKVDSKTLIYLYATLVYLYIEYNDDKETVFEYFDEYYEDKEFEDTLLLSYLIEDNLL